MAESNFMCNGNGMDYDDCYISTYTVPNNMAGINIGIKVTHIPSGLTAKCSSESSEWGNSNIAIKALKELIDAGYQLPLF